MSDGDEQAEEEVYEFVAAVDDSDASSDDESLASALKLLQPPSAAEPRVSNNQPLSAAGQAPARAEEEAGESGGAEVRVVNQGAHPSALETDPILRPGAGGLCAQLPAQCGPAAHGGGV